jgi:hypothetical protein
MCYILPNSKIHKKLFKEEDEDIKKLMKMIKNYRTKKEIKD